MPYLSLNQDLELFYETYGEHGPWVTLINGHTRSHSDFKAFAKFLMNENYRVLIFDNRGSGQTKYQSIESLEDLSSDVEALWSHLGITKSHLLGISMGGMIAQKLAAASDIVQTLTLVSTSPESKWLMATKTDWGHSIDEVTRKLNEYFSERFVERNKLLIQAMAKQILKSINEGSFEQGAKDQKKIIEDIDLSSDVKAISCPCLIIHGEKDKIIDPKAAELLNKQISESKLTMVPAVGHLLLAEYAKSLYQNVHEFISSN